MAVILDVLDDESGSAAAMVMAKKGIYGWQGDDALRLTEEHSERFGSMIVTDPKQRLQDDPVDEHTMRATFSQCGEEDNTLSDSAIADIDKELDAYLMSITPNKERWREVTSEEISLEMMEKPPWILE